MSEFEQVLKKLEASDLFPEQKISRPFIFDFSDNNEELDSIDLNDRDQFQAYIKNKIAENDAAYGIGKYAENRILYRRFGLFESEDSRSFHLGTDIWMPAGTPISAPFDGVVHSFADNANPGDYGPTIILSHRIEGYTFYTLYGHLNRDSIAGLKIGKEIRSGKKFCKLGKWEENLFWPPHLHFQVILNMQSYKGDYPGVCNYDEKEIWMAKCPDPNLILKIKME